jgi:hypothetical protein
VDGPHAFNTIKRAGEGIVNMPIEAKLKEISKKYGWAMSLKGREADRTSNIDAEFKRGEEVVLTVCYRPDEKHAEITDYNVMYSSVSQVYDSGQVDQFSPFDDGPPYPTALSVEEWLDRKLEYFLEHLSFGPIGWGK